MAASSSSQDLSDAFFAKLIEELDNSEVDDSDVVNVANPIYDDEGILDEITASPSTKTNGSPAKPHERKSQSSEKDRRSHLEETQNEPSVSGQLEDIVVPLRLNAVNAVFNLSKDKEFFCEYETLAAFPSGKVSQMNSKKMVIQFSKHNGKCEILRSGVVRCFGQTSFEESAAVAKRVVYEFYKYSKLEVGVYNYKFVNAFLTAELPFRVNLTKMTLYDIPGFSLDPGVYSRATFKYEDLGATLTVHGNTGKINLICAGENSDCTNLPDTFLSKARTAVNRMAEICSAFNLKLTSRQAHEDDGLMFPTQRTPMAPRRSERLLFSAASSPENRLQKLPDWAEKAKKSLPESSVVLNVLLETSRYSDKPAFFRLIQNLAVKISEHDDLPVTMDDLKQLGREIGLDEVLPRVRGPIVDPEADAKLLKIIETQNASKKKKKSKGVPVKKKKSPLKPYIPTNKFKITKIMTSLLSYTEHDMVSVVNAPLLIQDSFGNAGKDADYVEKKEF